jgi:hypothetical protein
MTIVKSHNFHSNKMLEPCLRHVVPISRLNYIAKRTPRTNLILVVARLTLAPSVTV